jgi:hypothetical protein
MGNGPAHDRPRNGPAAEEEKKKVGGGRAAYIEKGHSLLGALELASTKFDCCSLGKYGWIGDRGEIGPFGLRGDAAGTGSADVVIGSSSGWLAVLHIAKAL